MSNPHHEEIPLTHRPVSHSFTQTAVSAQGATVATLAVLDTSGQAIVTVMTGMEHVAKVEGSRSMDLLLGKGD